MIAAQLTDKLKSSSLSTLARAFGRHSFTCDTAIQSWLQNFKHAAAASTNSESNAMLSKLKSHATQLLKAAFRRSLGRHAAAALQIWSNRTSQASMLHTCSEAEQSRIYQISQKLKAHAMNFIQAAFRRATQMELSAAVQQWQTGVTQHAAITRSRIEDYATVAISSKLMACCFSQWRANWLRWVSNGGVSQTPWTQQCSAAAVPLQAMLLKWLATGMRRWSCAKSVYNWRWLWSNHSIRRYKTEAEALHNSHTYHKQQICKLQEMFRAQMSRLA